MMTTEAFAGLEEIPEILDRKIGELVHARAELDHLLQIVKSVDEQESKLCEGLYNAKNIQEHLYLFFDGNKAKEEIQVLGQKLKSLEDELKKRGILFSEEIKDKELNEETLKAHHNSLLKFLCEQMNFLNEKILKCQEKIFDGARSEINERFDTLDCLINKLVKKIEESSLDKVDLKELLNKECKQALQSRDKIPPALKDIVKLNKDIVKGLYNKVKQEISSSQDKVRQLAIENKLLSENEIRVLEVLYKLRIKELKLSEGIKHLKEKLGIEEGEIQGILHDLDEKGFVTLKLITE